MGWITMNGTHIYIKKGESKDAAIKRFLSGKKKTIKGNGKTNTDKVLAKNDYTEIINTLPKATQNKLARAYKDLDFYSKGTPAYENIKDYINKTEAKAATLYNKQSKSSKYTKKRTASDIKRDQDKLLNAQDKLKSVTKSLNNISGSKYSEKAIALKKEKAKLEESIRKLNKKGIK